MRNLTVVQISACPYYQQSRLKVFGVLDNDSDRLVPLFEDQGVICNHACLAVGVSLFLKKEPVGQWPHGILGRCRGAGIDTPAAISMIEKYAKEEHKDSTSWIAQLLSRIGYGEQMSEAEYTIRKLMM